ncbi:putative transcriptional regulator, ArsR family [Thiomonas sp. X19]|uniref:ArsR/SmtB family transcription factor n=1 Tax=Thiomonas sp. X19 TaxID=1050370 RepID=UPI000B756776|nr:metalloregulator ArsR/SmtB family transcription factor [Thiomonas sp. X19]SCC94559.1 putative transcriptional regulator, ArsR family [Thiomonas sp. X19]
METNQALSALAALAQDSRLRVFRTLVQAGPAGLAAGQIADITGIAPSSLSFHLKELSHAQLLSSRQAGRFVIYTAQYDTMNALLAFLTENCCGGNPCSAIGGTVCAVPAASPSPQEL